ncbi:MAG: beta-ketoacyl synthase chain length factor [Massilia sp.]
MSDNGVNFSVARSAAWAPGLDAAGAWASWAAAPWRIEPGAEPAVAAMPAMLRRRAGSLGKMALEVAYECLDGRTDVPTVFCSRHGEVGRAVGLLSDMAGGEPVSPTAFGLAVHNASAGLLSIARADRANHIALCAGQATVEHAVIEACALLADGAPLVLLVAYDAPLPPVLSRFEDSDEQPHAFAWLLAPAGEKPIRLSWSLADPGHAAPEPGRAMPGGLEVLRFYLGGAGCLQRRTGAQHWTWSRDA